MKTLKKSIITAMLALGCFTTVQAQEDSQPAKGTHIKSAQISGVQKINTIGIENEDVVVNRKGWDGTIKGKQSQGVTFGEKVNAKSETGNKPNQSENKTIFAPTTSTKKEYVGHVTLMK